MFVSLSALTGDVNPTRVASYVVSGVGFLGGGVILRDGLNVRGVDTAATLWGSAAVGALTGCGFPLHGLIGTVAVLTANVLLKRLSRRLDHRRLPVDVETSYRVRVVCDGEQSAALREALIQHIATVPKLVVHGVATRHAKRRRAEIVADISSSERCDHTMEGLVVRLNAAPGVIAVSWEMVRHTTA